MKTFDEISDKCPFLSRGCQRNLKFCIARANFQNQKSEVIACNKDNCAVFYIANTLIQESFAAHITGKENIEELEQMSKCDNDIFKI